MSEIPAWLELLVDAVAAQIRPHDQMGPVGFRFRQDEAGWWDIIVYPTPVELVGGAVDGEVGTPGFAYDLESLRPLFERVDRVVWNAHGVDVNDEDGPSIEVHGLYGGRELRVRFLAYAPEGEEPTIKLDTRNGL